VSDRAPTVTETLYKHTVCQSVPADTVRYTAYRCVYVLLADAHCTPPMTVCVCVLHAYGMHIVEDSLCAATICTTTGQFHTAATSDSTQHAYCAKKQHTAKIIFTSCTLLHTHSLEVDYHFASIVLITSEHTHDGSVAAQSHS
jgi:hypothetical protein